MPTQPITFYDNYEAPLRAGSYRLVLQQTVTIEGEAPRYYYRDQSFEVLAPRYAIDADEIQAYFPPNGGVADYENVLPHLVLTARNLPWERKLWDKGSEPWLALLVVSDQEMRDGNVTFRTGTVADLAPQATGSVLLPNFKRTEDANTPVRLLDLDLALFRKLCPTRTELPLLAHIRRVEMEDKVPTEMVASGDFSVLVANRFPAAGTNNVYLISLEGWHELFEKPADTPLAASRLRLVTLGTWTFVNDKSGHDTFGGLMQQLKNNSALVGVTLPASTGRADVDQALKRGYVPLDYKPRESTPAFAWYRGPLASATRKRLSETVFERADEAMIFDPEQGLLDVSYSSSWELGRLLALSSPAFVKGLRLFVERKQNAAELALEIKRFIDLHRTSFKEPVTDDPKPPQIAIAKDLVDWLARLVLLYPVPFHYLVPHQSLLPSESIRFFHLDDNWVDALLDGALSIAIPGDVRREDYNKPRLLFRCSESGCILNEVRTPYDEYVYPVKSSHKQHLASVALTTKAD